jgi:hypothetical protein
MRIQSLLQRKSDFAQIAVDSGTTPEYLIQIAYGHSRASFRLAQKLEEVAGISRHETRPDIFGAAPDKAA